MLPLLSVSDVYLTYTGADGRDIDALVSISLEVGHREFVTFVGASGCGKTTLLKIMSGLIPVSRGQVRFKGQILTDPPKQIGMAFQDPLLLPWRTVIDNVLLPVEILGLKKKHFVHKTMDLLATVGLAGFENKPTWQLSGGMRQRVSLCRALINDPEILYLDEPFAALDAFTREDLWLVIQKLHVTFKCTILLVTHQLEEAVFLSDRVIVLGPRPGRIVFEQNIPLHRPRSLDDIVTPEFLAIRHRLKQEIAR